MKMNEGRLSTYNNIRTTLLKELNIKWNVHYAFTNRDRIQFGRIRSIRLLEYLLDCDTRSEVRHRLAQERMYDSEGKHKEAFYD